MPCFHPLRAWKTDQGTVHLGREPPDAAPLPLPCGTCLGCQMAIAKGWALRCHLEMQQHRNTVFTTLTYDDDHVPITLHKPRDKPSHLQLWLKRLRKTTRARLRFFASGEYGETNYRPHYHAILYGLPETAAGDIDRTWGLGHTKTERITPARIAYVAGYCAKKIGWRADTVEERIDYETGEVYRWQPPFIQMSRRPGIGGNARQWVNSWRAFAVLNGTTMKVPRFLHDAWKAQATNEELEQLIYERYKLALGRDNSKERLEAAEQIAIKRQELHADKRKL